MLNKYCITNDNILNLAILGQLHLVLRYMHFPSIILMSVHMSIYPSYVVDCSSIHIETILWCFHENSSKKVYNKQNNEECLRDMKNMSLRSMVNWVKNWNAIDYSIYIIATTDKTLSHQGVQLILSYSWAKPAILVAGKGRGGMFLFLLFLHLHFSSAFFPVSLFHLLYYLFDLFSSFLWEMTQNDPQELTCC